MDLLKTPYGREIDMRKLEISWRAYLCVKKSIVDFFFPLFKKPQPSKCYFDGGGEWPNASTTYIVLKCEKKRNAAYLHCNFFYIFFLKRSSSHKSRSTEHINTNVDVIFFKSNQAITRAHIFIAPFSSSFNLLNFETFWKNYVNKYVF